MPRKTRETFSSEFKREAVRQLEQGDKEAAQLARELGIRRNQLYKWKAKIDVHGARSFPGKGRRIRGEATSRDLEAENKLLRERKTRY